MTGAARGGLYHQRLYRAAQTGALPWRRSVSRQDESAIPLRLRRMIMAAWLALPRGCPRPAPLSPGAGRQRGRPRLLRQMRDSGRTGADQPADAPRSGREAAALLALESRCAVFAPGLPRPGPPRRGSTRRAPDAVTKERRLAPSLFLSNSISVGLLALTTSGTSFTIMVGPCSVGSTYAPAPWNPEVRGPTSSPQRVHLLLAALHHHRPATMDDGDHRPWSASSTISALDTAVRHTGGSFRQNVPFPPTLPAQWKIDGVTGLVGDHGSPARSKGRPIRHLATAA